MYHTVRRAGKRYIVSKLNGGTNNNVIQDNPHTIKQQQILNHTVVSARNTCCEISAKSGVAKPFRNITKKLLQLKFVKEKNSFHAHSIHTLSSKVLLNPTVVEDCLKERQVSYKKGFTGVLVPSKCCSSTGHKTFVDSRTGNSTCRCCGMKHTWEDLLSQFDEINIGIEQSKSETVDVILGNPQTHDQWLNSIDIDIQALSKPLNSLSLNTYLTYNVRLTQDKCKITLPYYDISKENILQCIIFDPDTKAIVKICPEESLFSLYGWHTIKDEDRTVVLTSSEFDCMSVWEATGIPSLAISSLDAGLPPDVLPFLEQFDKIILWFSDEYRDQENLQNFARKLNLDRCWKVCSIGTPFSMHNTLGKETLNTAIQKSQHMAHDHIITFKDLRLDLYNELMNAKKNAGISFARFPALNEYLKGHRRGELTVFTGATGSGKTTFLSELSLDLCIQGVKTLWGSFEIKNLRLLNTMMHQYAGFAIQNHMDKYMKWSEQFENLPMFFMSYYGARDLQDVLNTIEYAVYTLDIEHVVIDNLQFMTSVQGSSDDRFLAMDRAIAAFRRCASEFNIHVTVVVHPRKENDGGSLQTASIYGSAKASQEADNVFILQTSDERSMQVTKNRFCGSVGILPLSFHPDSLCLSGFHRNMDTEEEILPALRVKRPVSNVKVMRNKERK